MNIGANVELNRQNLIFSAASGSTSTIGGVISSSGAFAGEGGLTNTGGGTLILGSSNTYAGFSNVLGGTLRLGGSTFANRLSDNAELFVGGSNIFDLDGRFERVGVLTGSGQVDLGTNVGSGLGLVVDYTGLTAKTFSGKIIGTGVGARLIKEGTGTLILSGTNNTYQGGTFISAGTLQVSSFNALGQPAIPTILTFNGGTLNTTGRQSSQAERAWRHIRGQRLENTHAQRCDQRRRLTDQDRRRYVGVAEP